MANCFLLQCYKTYSIIKCKNFIIKIYERVEFMLEHESNTHCHDENCDCGHEHDTLLITLDDDTELECNVIGIFEVNDKEYIALLPIDDDSVLLYQYSEEGENVELTSIEDDDEFQEVTDAFFELYNDELDDEDKSVESVSIE